jgi:hypothetical protein
MILTPYILWLLCNWAQPGVADIRALQVVNAYIEQLERGGLTAWEFHVPSIEKGR